MLYDIICPPLEGQAAHQEDELKVWAAIQRHFSIAAVARVESAMGTSSPPFKAIFKSNEHRQFITDLFHKTSFRSHSPEPWKPQIRLYTNTSRGSSMGIRNSRPVAEVYVWKRCFAVFVASEDFVSMSLYLRTPERHASAKPRDVPSC